MKKHKAQSTFEEVNFFSFENKMLRILVSLEHRISKYLVQNNLPFN